MKAALIAGGLWGQRIYGSKLSAAAPVDEARLKALGALRKGVEEGNLAPHIGIAIGRGLKLFTDYLPRHLPELGDQFRAATGLSVDQYFELRDGLEHLHSAAAMTGRCSSPHRGSGHDLQGYLPERFSL